MAADKSRNLGKDRPHRHLSWNRWLPLLIIGAGLSVYANSFNGVLLFDDAPHILKNERIRRLRPVSELIGGRRPVVDVSLALNYRLSKLDVRGYHAVNLGVHILAALTLFGIIRRTLLRERFGEGIDEVSNVECRLSNRGPFNRKSTFDNRQFSAPWIACVTALIWVVHPLQTQSVTYLIQRAESLMGLFYLLTLYCVIRGADNCRMSNSRPFNRQSSIHNRHFWLPAAVVSCALGMGSKGVMVTAPAMVLLYDRVFISGSWSDTLRRRWALYVGLAATWSVLWACGVAHGVLNPATKGAHVGFAYTDVTPLNYALTQFGALLQYLKLSVWPSPLCLDYTWPVAQSPGRIIPQAIVIVLLLVSGVWAFFRAPRLGFLAAWFFVILAPTSSFIPIKDTLFEHRVYLSLAAVVIAVVVAGDRWVAHLFSGTRPIRERDGGHEWSADSRPPRLKPWGTRADAKRRFVASALAVTAVAVLGYGTVRRNQDYHNVAFMWRDVAAKRPNNARAFEQLGTALVMEGKKNEAVVEYQNAVQIDSDFASVHANLANALSQTGRFEEAVRHYREVIRIEPDHIEACTNMGHALDALGLADEAIEAYRAAAGMELRRTDPAVLARAHLNLGSALGNQGDLNAAIAEYREAVKLRPDYDNAHFWWGVASERLGNLREAVNHYSKTLKINPQHRRARQALDDALMKLRRLDSD